MSHVYVLPYRHPLMAAKAFLTLDELSGGRALLGVGAGHVQCEFELLGVDFAGRGRALDESIDVVRAAFVDEYPEVDTPSFARRRRRAAPAAPPGRRARRSGSAGRRRPALRRAADKGDGWLPQGPPDGGMQRAVAWLAERRQENGRADQPFAIGANCESCTSATRGSSSGPQHLAGAPEPMAERLRNATGRRRRPAPAPLPLPLAPRAVRPDRAFGADVAPLLNTDRPDADRES